MTEMSHTSAYATKALTHPMTKANDESRRMRLSLVKSARRSSALSDFSFIRDFSLIPPPLLVLRRSPRARDAHRLTDARLHGRAGRALKALRVAGVLGQCAYK